MATPKDAGTRGPDAVPASDMTAQRKATYARLFRKFVWLTILCSLVPLLLVGWGINLHYTRFARERMLNFFETQVEYHRKIIEMFLNEHSSKLQLIAQTHTRDEIVEPGALQTAFEVFNKDLWSLTDLGVIGEHGYHLAYAGPYDLWSRNYSKEFWFTQVMQKGLYISEMFMGFRKEPHFIIAVTQSNGDQKWILRATINTEAFRALVENVRIGKTGQAYLLNAEGVFQTSPRMSGSIMEKSTYPMESYHEGIQVRILEDLKDADGKYVMADDPRLDPVFSALAKNGRTLVAHLGEPRNCWLPVDQMTVDGDRRYFSANPQYHGLLHPEVPNYEAQVAARADGDHGAPAEDARSEAEPGHGAKIASIAMRTTAISSMRFLSLPAWAAFSGRRWRAEHRFSRRGGCGRRGR